MIAITTPRIWPGKSSLSESGSPATSDFSRFTGLDRLFDVLLDGLSVHPTARRTVSKGSFHPALDIRREEKAYIVSLEIPGVEENNLRVDVGENELTISGEKRFEYETRPDENIPRDSSTYYSERAYGSFTRVLSLPADVDAGAIAATYKNGVLTLSLPRKEPEKPSVRSINIAKE